MSDPSPTLGGLVVTPNAAGDVNNPAASDQEVQGFRYWGRYALVAELPNNGANAATSPSYEQMRPGDVAFAQATQRMYVLEDRGTSGGDDAVWVELASATAESAVLTWGAFSVQATTTTRYLFVGGATAAGSAPTVSERQYRMPRPGTLQNMRVRHNAPGGNGNAIVYTVRINNVATALSVSLASTAADGSDLASAVAIAAGDLIDIEVTKALAVGGGGNFIALVSLELT